MLIMMSYQFYDEYGVVEVIPQAEITQVVNNCYKGSCHLQVITNKGIFDLESGLGSGLKSEEAGQMSSLLKEGKVVDLTVSGKEYNLAYVPIFTRFYRNIKKVSPSQQP